MEANQQPTHQPVIAGLGDEESENYNEEVEYCDGCDVELEEGRIGYCDGCIAARDGEQSEYGEEGENE